MMREWKKRIVLPVMAAVLLPGAVMTSASASSVRGGVADMAGLLTEEEKQELVTQTAQIEEETGWNIYVVSTEDAEGKTAQEYADDYFDEYAPGADGVVALIDMDNREIAISTTGDAINYLNDARIDTILDNAYNDVSEGDYAACYTTMLEGVEWAYQKGIPSDAHTYNEETGEVVYYRSIKVEEIIGAVVIAAIVWFAVYFGIAGKYRFKHSGYTYDFHSFGNVSLTNTEDRYVNQIVTHRRIPKPQNNGGNGSGPSGRSTVHTGSSGTMHGGGSRKF